MVLPLAATILDPLGAGPSGRLGRTSTSVVGKRVRARARLFDSACGRGTVGA